MKNPKRVLLGTTAFILSLLISDLLYRIALDLLVKTKIDWRVDPLIVWGYISFCARPIFALLISVLIHLSGSYLLMRPNESPTIKINSTAILSRSSYIFRDVEA
jgi:hypothetical protein